MRRLRARVLVWFFSCVFATHAQSAASSAAEPRIQVTNCPEELAGPLPAVIKLEIDVLLRERGPTRAPPERITIRCAQDRAQIAVTMDGASRESSIELGVLAAQHRARAVALAAAELVHSMSHQPVAEATASPPLSKTRASSARPSLFMDSAASPERSPPEVSSRSGWQRPTLLVGGLAQWLGKPATPLFGARVAFHYPVGPVVVPALSSEASLGGFPSQSARVSVATLSAAGHLYFGMTTGNARWDAGPGARFGWARLAGHPNDGVMLEGHSLTAAWAGPEARARVAYGPSPLRSPVIALELGAGFVALPVRGLVDGGARIYAVEGPWLSVCAEVGVGL